MQVVVDTFETSQERILQLISNQYEVSYCYNQPCVICVTTDLQRLIQAVTLDVTDFTSDLAALNLSVEVTPICPPS